MRSAYSLGMIKNTAGSEYVWFKHYPKMDEQWQYIGSNRYLTQFTPHYSVVSKVHLAHNCKMLYTEFKELL